MVGNGHCVAYVRACTGLPPTAQWTEGEAVWDRMGDLAPGTCIATFDEQGRYANATDGSSHAAVFVRPVDTGPGGGIEVWDQWVGHPVSMRVIRFKGGAGPACDDADAYNVIEVVAE